MQRRKKPDSLKELLLTVRSPGAFVRAVIGATPTDQQNLVLDAIARGDTRIAIRSGHGVGKSALLAWLLLWWLSTKPHAVAPCTAPTSHQLEDILWGEVSRWHKRMREPFRGLLTVGKGWVRHGLSPEDWFAVARTARRENPEALQGFHGAHLAFLIDEASGVPQEIFEVAEGALSTPGALVVMAGNPTRREGAFFEAFHADRAHWSTFRLPSNQSSLVSQEYATRMEMRFGADSDIYKVRVLGDFPSSEPDSLIGLRAVEEAARRECEPPFDTPLVYGVDVARFGDDETVILKRKGLKVLEVLSHKGLDTMKTCGQVARAAKAERPALIYVDVVGVGAGVADRLREIGLPVYQVNVAERPADTSRYDDLRSELWWRVKEWVESPETSLARDAELIAQLSTIKYELTSLGKIRIESKRDRKKRGLSSPDRADALMLTFAGSPAIFSQLGEKGMRFPTGADNLIDRELGF